MNKLNIEMALNENDAPLGGERHLRVSIPFMGAAVDLIATFAIVVVSSNVYAWFAFDKIAAVMPTIELSVLLSFVYVLTNAMNKRYSLRNYLTPKGQLSQTFNTWNVAIVAFIAIGFMTKLIDELSRGAIVMSYLSGMVVAPVSRYLLSRAVLKASKTGRVAACRVLLVGRQRDMIAFLTNHQPWNNGMVVEFMAPLREVGAQASAAERDHALNKDLADAVAHARNHRPDAVFIAVPWSERHLIDRCTEAFMNVPVSISLTSERILDRFENPRIQKLGQITSLELLPRPLSTTEVFLKRVFDGLVALVALVLLSPLFLAVAIAIRLDSKGPVFFLQRRYGFNQEEFRIFKFRTMRTMDDGDIIQQATKGDPRITQVGRWLRRFNIDELPQLLNVLAGHMSLVGPRPHALAHDREFETKIALYARRLNVKPGITGWAQVNGLRGETDTVDKMARRVEYDHWYIDNWSFLLDLAILVRTVISRKAFRNAV
jgi:Undecaprenyl-phosphate glucose phosphotransferase